MAEIDKETIRRRFARGIPTYGSEASTQRGMAQALISHLTPIRREFRHVLEVGTGTGILTDMIEQNLKFDSLILNDIVPECAALHSGRSARFITGDIETVEIPGTYDLVISNATFQWLKDLGGTLARLTKILDYDGILAFTTFGPQNLKEIADATGNSLRYHSADEICGMLSGDFSVLYRNEEFHTLEFKTPVDVLRHLKNSGTNAASAEPWTKGALNSFSWFYREHHQNSAGNCVLTYHPMTFIARRISGKKQA